MNLISSSWNQTVRPIGYVILFAIVGQGVLIGAFVSVVLETPIILLFTLILTAMFAVVGFSRMALLWRDLVDEVWDAGDRLVVRRGDQVVQIPISQCSRVVCHLRVNPKRVKLYLHEPCELGSVIVFLPPFELLNFTAPTVVKRLVKKIEAKQTERRHAA